MVEAGSRFAKNIRVLWPTCANPCMEVGRMGNASFPFFLRFSPPSFLLSSSVFQTFFLFFFVFSSFCHFLLFFFLFRFLFLLLRKANEIKTCRVKHASIFQPCFRNPRTGNHHQQEARTKKIRPLKLCYVLGSAAPAGAPVASQRRYWPPPSPVSARDENCLKQLRRTQKTP